MQLLVAHSIYTFNLHKPLIIPGDIMVKLEIFTDCSRAFDRGIPFAFATPEQESQITERCKNLAEFKETNFVILRHNAPLNPVAIEI